MVGIAWYCDLQLPVPSVPITTRIVSLNPDHNEMYSIKHNGIMFASEKSLKIPKGYNQNPSIEEGQTTQW